MSKSRHNSKSLVFRLFFFRHKALSFDSFSSPSDGYLGIQLQQIFGIIFSLFLRNVFFFSIIEEILSQFGMRHEFQSLSCEINQVNTYNNFSLSDHVIFNRTLLLFLLYVQRILSSNSYIQCAFRSLRKRLCMHYFVHNSRMSNRIQHQLGSLI